MNPAQPDCFFGSMAEGSVNSYHGSYTLGFEGYSADSPWTGPNDQYWMQTPSISDMNIGVQFGHALPLRALDGIVEEEDAETQSGASGVTVAAVAGEEQRG